MKSEVVFQDESNKTQLTVSIEKAIQVIAKAMLANGSNMVNVKVDGLHDASLTLQWMPKEVKGFAKNPKGHQGDDDCG